MRIIKMTIDQVGGDGTIEKFFRSIGEITPPRPFYLPSGRLGDSLYPGEPILFSIDAVIRYVARTTSGRENNTDPKNDYDYYFTMDPYSIRRVYVPFDAIQYRVTRAKALSLSGDPVNVRTQGWNAIVDTEETAALFAELVREGQPV